MNINDFNYSDLVACFFAILGGIIRFILDVDDLPRIKQFALIFFAAGPVGYLCYSLASDYGFDKAAYPVAFITGIMAISIVTKLAKDGIGYVTKYLEKKIKL